MMLHDDQQHQHHGPAGGRRCMGTPLPTLQEVSPGLERDSSERSLSLLTTTTTLSSRSLLTAMTATTGSTNSTTGGTGEEEESKRPEACDDDEDDRKYDGGGGRHLHFSENDSNTVAQNGAHHSCIKNKPLHRVEFKENHNHESRIKRTGRIKTTGATDTDCNTDTDHPPSNNDDNHNSTSTNNNSALPTLLEEAEECIAQSNLIFLLADLRLLSATGRIHTTYDTIAIDSDRISRVDSGCLAHKMAEDLKYGKDFTPECHGMFPAQIMAVLLIELRKEVKSLKTRQKQQQEEAQHEERFAANTLVYRKKRLAAAASAAAAATDNTTTSQEDDDSDSSCESCSTSSSSDGRNRMNPRRGRHTKKTTRVVEEQASLFSTWTNQKGRKQYEVDMHNSLIAYSDMIGKDLSTDRPEITRRQLMERMKSYYFKYYSQQQAQAKAQSEGHVNIGGGEAGYKGEGDEAQHEQSFTTAQQRQGQSQGPLRHLRESIMAHYHHRRTSSNFDDDDIEEEGDDNDNFVFEDGHPHPTLAAAAAPKNGLSASSTRKESFFWSAARRPTFRRSISSPVMSMPQPETVGNKIQEDEEDFLKNIEEEIEMITTTIATATAKNDESSVEGAHGNLGGTTAESNMQDNSSSSPIHLPLSASSPADDHIRLGLGNSDDTTGNKEDPHPQDRDCPVYVMSSASKDRLLDHLNAAAEENEKKREQTQKQHRKTTQQQPQPLPGDYLLQSVSSLIAESGSPEKKHQTMPSVSSRSIEGDDGEKEIKNADADGDGEIEKDFPLKLPQNLVLSKPRSMLKHGRSLTWTGRSKLSSVLAGEAKAAADGQGEGDLAAADHLIVANSVHGTGPGGGKDGNLDGFEPQPPAEEEEDNDNTNKKQQTRSQSLIPPRVGAYLQHVRESNREKMQTQRKNIQNTKERVAVKAAAVKETVNQKMDRLQKEVDQKKATAAAAVRSEEAANRQSLENLVNDFFQVGAKATTEGGDLSTSFTRPLTEDELLDLMERAVESRRRERVSFMASFFREGTVSQLMAKSTSKVVWLNDWYPLKDPTYAISMDTEKKRVLVVFRGAITRADWGHSKDFYVKRTPNPIQSIYEGRKKHLKLHRGFYLYMFRRRKDTGTSKYDEIAAKVEQYAKVIGQDDCKIFVTGYSLGAALGTLFTFYGSLEERFTRNGPVKFISFGCPYVGGYAFADAFRYQEQQRKIVYARFHNERDIGESFLSLSPSC
jgi:hypothetical protein